ncbi:hypothetical protein [Pantoea agglomerans]|uniref:hypothetical protein n=1 Tax=Enterobacter agglomerans TaxID=549 RepID=UPI000B79E583|nr:hypothetical protein [Pantoea agglomerans]OXH79216.1 hypothetical protein CBI57_06760 [Pantoea agglomerans]
MSDVDYEALGRCEHLKGQFNEALRQRDWAASRLSSLSTLYSSSMDMILIANIKSIEEAVEQLKLHQGSLEKIVAEYNTWAEKAKKKPMQFTAKR